MAKATSKKAETSVSPVTGSNFESYLNSVAKTLKGSLKGTALVMALDRARSNALVNITNGKIDIGGMSNADAITLINTIFAI